MATRQFNEKKAAEELARYRANGAGPTMRLLEDGIGEVSSLSGSLLDVGCGIGALTLRLLDRGMTRAVGVDASAAYIAVARAEAERQGRARAVQFIHADFLLIASQLPSAQVVTLDRVVCCYPAFAPLLDAAIRRADACIALSYPRDTWYVRLAVMMENAQRWFAGNPFRTVVHPARQMHRLIAAAGFERRSRRQTWMWSVDVYVKRAT